MVVALVLCGRIFSCASPEHFKKEVVSKPLLLPRQVSHRAEMRPGEGLQGLATVTVHAHLRGDPAEPEMVCNHESVHIIVFWQVGIGFLEFSDLLGIENVDFVPELSQAAILSECVDKAIAVDGRGLQADYDIVHLYGIKC